MNSSNKKFLFKAIIEILFDLKLKNQEFIRVKKIRNILERKLNYSNSPNYLGHFISASLDWLVTSGYLVLIKENKHKKYLILEKFLVNYKNLEVYF